MRSMPSGSSDRMASLTSWPSTGRASTVLSFLTTGGAPRRSPGTMTPRPASSPSVATRTSPTSSLRPGMPFQRAASASSAAAQLVEGLGGLRRRRGQRHVAQLEGGLGGLAGSGPVTGRGGGQPEAPPLRRRTGTARRRLPQRAGVEQLLHALPDRLHLVAVEGRLGRGAVPAAEVDVGHVDLEGHVAHQRDDAGVRRGPAPRSRSGSRAASASCSLRCEKMPSRSP